MRVSLNGAHLSNIVRKFLTFGGYMAQQIQRYAIHWTDSAFKYKRGKWVLWKDVAPYIVEVKNQRTTAKVRKPKRPAHV